MAAISASEEGEGFHHGELWLLCGGLGVGLLCLYIIALLHVSKDEKSILLLPKVGSLLFFRCVSFLGRFADQEIACTIDLSPYHRNHHHLSPSRP